jgi:hypothetical protein
MPSAKILFTYRLPATPCAPLAEGTRLPAPGYKALLPVIENLSLNYSPILV